MFDQLVILAGGIGERLKPITNTIPKPLVKVGKRSIIEQIIKDASESGIKSILILAGYLGELIEKECSYWSQKYDVYINFEKTPAEYLSGKRVYLARKYLRGDIVFSYGDNYVQQDYIELYKFYRNYKTLLLSVGCFPREGKSGNLFVKNDLLISYKDQSSSAQLTDVGLLCINNKEIANSKELINEKFEDWFFRKVSRNRILTNELPYFTLTNKQTLDIANKSFKEKLTLFIDRDGTINKLAPKGNFITTIDELQFDENALRFLKEINEYIERIIIVTNQAWVENESDYLQYEKLKLFVEEKFEQVGVDVFTYSCFDSFHKSSDFRKPKPGMLVDAIRDHKVIRKKSILLGDQTTDLVAAENLRIKSIRTCYNQWDYSTINKCVSILLKEF